MKPYILALGLFLAACAAPSTPAVILPQLLPTPTAYIDPSYPTTEANVRTANQTAGGIDIRVERAWMDGKNVNANICFTLPDASDWSIWSASLNYGETVLQEYGTALLSVQEPSAGQPGVRCDTLTFVVPPDADLSSASIVINSIAAAPREGEYCSVYLPKIQQSLLQRGIGIVLECVEVNGVQTMQITSIPPEMSREQAEQLVYSDEFFSIQGPWTFVINLVQ